MNKLNPCPFCKAPPSATVSVSNNGYAFTCSIKCENLSCDTPIIEVRFRDEDSHTAEKIAYQTWNWCTRYDWHTDNISLDDVASNLEYVGRQLVDVIEEIEESGNKELFEINAVERFLGVMEDITQDIKVLGHKAGIEIEENKEALHKCPFCGGENFDLLGLKWHLSQYCRAYKEV